MSMQSELLQMMNDEIKELRTFRDLSLEAANRAGFDSVVTALDSIGHEQKESIVMYGMLCELWPRNKKPLNQVIGERVGACTQAE